MSTFNRFLSRKDKTNANHHPDQRTEVVPPRLLSDSHLPEGFVLSTMTPYSSKPPSQLSRRVPVSSSSPRAVSLAFTDFKLKRSPSLTAADGSIECISANMINFMLQPSDYLGPLHGVFFDDEKPKKGGKIDETKVCKS